MPDTTIPPTKAEIALAYCATQGAFYELQKTRQRRLHQITQILMIFLSGITPVLILAGDIPPVVQAIPPAIVTILAALSNGFQWKENYLRFANTSEQLKAEKVQFETHAGEYHSKLSERTRVNRFVMRLVSITSSEVIEWRTLMQSADPGVAAAMGFDEDENNDDEFD